MKMGEAKTNGQRFDVLKKMVRAYAEKRMTMDEIVEEYGISVDKDSTELALMGHWRRWSWLWPNNDGPKPPTQFEIDQFFNKIVEAKN